MSTKGKKRENRVQSKLMVLHRKLNREEKVTHHLSQNKVETQAKRIKNKIIKTENHRLKELFEK